MSLGILIRGADKPQKNITLGQKSGPGLLIKKLPKNTPCGGRHAATLTGFAVNSQNTRKLQTHEIFLFRDITGEG